MLDKTSRWLQREYQSMNWLGALTPPMVLPVQFLGVLLLPVSNVEVEVRHCRGN